MLPVMTWLLTPAIASLFAFFLWKGLDIARGRTHTPLRHLRGPKGTSLFFGNLIEINSNETGELMRKWVKEYGETLRFKGFLNSDQLFTMDTSAINHILTHSNDYQKPPVARESLARIFGEGLLVVEGAQHRQQRRVMNPAFGPAQIRELTNTFLAKASRLCDVLSSEIAKDPTTSTDGTHINIVPWLNKVTLDIIGLTGFNYNFNSLDSDGRTSKLSEAFSIMFSASQNITAFSILQSFIPVLHLIPTSESRKIQAAKYTMIQIGEELLTNAKKAVMATGSGQGEIEKSNLHGRDLLSLLVKANMASDVPEDQKLSDKDVILQVPTFLVAGHETTSTAVTWALYVMTQAPEIQSKLREELLSVDTDTPSMDELITLPYLDAVVRETLRLYAPVPGTSRIAMKDDTLPVEKPYMDRHGVMQNTIRIAKGDRIFVPILAMNQSEELWGPDALEFRPERLSNIPEAVSRVPGIWGHLMTFIGGQRACIGFRFSLVEFKAILFCLVRAFEFKLAVPASEICSRTAIVQRPVLRSDATFQAQLPLLIKLYRRT